MSDSSRVFSIFSHALNISRRVNWLHLTRQMLSIALMLSLAFPQTVWADTFSTVNAFSLTSLWAQIKGAASGKEPTLMDPLERPNPTDAPRIKSKDKEEQKSKVTKLDSSLPNKIQLETREKMNFSAVPVDSDNKALHGLEVEYQSSNPEVVFIRKNGEAWGAKPGTVEIIVSAGAGQLRYQVTVVAPAKPSRKGEQKIGSNSGGTKIYKSPVKFSKTRNIVSTYKGRNTLKKVSVAIRAVRLRLPITNHY